MRNWGDNPHEGTTRRRVLMAGRQLMLMSELYPSIKNCKTGYR
jgi:hypothetical protein